jgi:hypothetical protein
LRTVLSIHYYIVEVFLYEIALSDGIEAERYGTHSLPRLGMLHACLTSVKLLFDQVHAISASEWYDIPYITWALVGHAIVVLSRLTLCTAVGWDRESNCSIIDFSALIDALAQKFELDRNTTANTQGKTGKAVSQPIELPQIFLMVSSKLQHIKAAQEAKYAAQMDGSDQNSMPYGGDSTTLAMDDASFMSLSTPFFDFLDESFWQQLD